MSVNKENIDKTIARINQNKNFAFDMRDWGGSGEQKYDDTGHICGTCACIAGFATLASDNVVLMKETFEHYPENSDECIEVEIDVIDFCNIKLKSDRGSENNKAFDIGQDFLGITYEQAERLFTPSMPCYKLDQNVPDYFMVTADQAIKVLENLKETGKVDWRASGYGDGKYDAYWKEVALLDPNFKIAI